MLKGSLSFYILRIPAESTVYFSTAQTVLQISP